MRDVACDFAARFRFGPAALACCAGKRLRVSSAPHPCGFESHALGQKKKGLHRWRPNNSVVGDEGCPRAASPPAPRFVAPLLACCAGKRFAFPQLRTLSGSNPSAMGAKRKASITGGLTNQWWAMRDVACDFAARFRFGPAALACCAGKRLRVSSAPHPCGFESHALGPKKKGLHRWRPNKSMVGDEGFEPPALCV